LDALKDVNVVIAGGMGKKMYEDLLSAGKIVLVTDKEDCDGAVRDFLNGTLKNGSAGGCGCGH